MSWDFRRSSSTWQTGCDRLDIGLRYNKDSWVHRIIRIVVISAVSLTALTMVWWIISIQANTAAIPSPPEVWKAFLRVVDIGDPITKRPIQMHMLASFETLGMGFLAAFAVAIPAGLLIGYSKIVGDFSKPIIEVLRPIAPIAWAPIFIIGIFGYSWGPMMVVFIGIIFPLLTNTIFGIQKIDRNLIDAARTLGASKLQTFYKVMLPCTVPYIMSGVKIGLGIGWMCIIAAEYINPDGLGLGFYTWSVALNNSWPFAFVGIILFSILGILTTTVAEYAHKTISKRMGME